MQGLRREALRDGTWWLRRHPVSFAVGDVLIPSGDDRAEAARLRQAARAAVAGMCGEG